jgi:membrane protease YdiL (CAAX protease family)
MEHAPIPPPAPSPGRIDPIEPPAGAQPDAAAFPRWPIWMPFVAILSGVIAGVVVVSTVGAALKALDVTVKSGPLLTAVGTALIDLLVVGFAVLLARSVARPRPWHFGLRAGALGSTVGFAAAGLGSYYLFALVYSAAVKPNNPQRIVQDLGADTGTLFLILGALVVIVVAPFCEELFFRGFLFRAMRSRMPFWIAAAIDGALFGAVHGLSAVTLILVALGVVLCWVYERTGTLYAPIAIHAFNNTIAYGFTTEDGWVVAGVVGAAMLAGCAVAVVKTPRPAPMPPPPAPPPPAPAFAEPH